MPVRTIKVSGKKVFFYESGAKNKQVIIFLHGTPGNHMGLLALAKKFSKDYRVIVPDLPGWGHSEKFENQYNIKNYSKWLNDFLFEMKISKVMVVGHSFGSRIAICFGAKYSEKIEKLVLLAPMVKAEGFWIYLAHLNFNFAKLMPARIKKPMMFNRFYRKVAGMVAFTTKSAKLKAKIMENDKREFAKINYNVAINLLDEFYKINLTILAKKVKSRCLIVAGDKDRIVSLDLVRDLSKKIRGSVIKVLPGIGHIMPAENPKEIAVVVNSFFKAL